MGVMANAKVDSHNRLFTIPDLQELVKQGELRIPQFQRSFRWEQSDVVSLFDSLMHGYPVGNLLLWRREAPSAHVRIGVIDVDAPETSDALWVVDGQQRVTSLVNAVEAGVQGDRRFALGYSLKEGKVIALGRRQSNLVIPLPDLLDFAKVLAWLNEDPERTGYANALQQAAAKLQRVQIPATIMENASEEVLREVFDRINTMGKRLNSSEIFEAIHGGDSGGLTAESISRQVDAATGFGMVLPKYVTLALMVRRHQDGARDVHGEFDQSRQAMSDFPDETPEEAWRATKSAMLKAVGFLQDRCGIPHYAFLPFSFQFLVLVRFFAHFNRPHARNLELLTRWFWRTSAAASELGIGGSARDQRVMVGCIVKGEESESVQRLLAQAQVGDESPELPLRDFRVTRADAKVIMAMMWSRQPVDLGTGKPLTVEQLASHLDGETTATQALVELVPRHEIEKGAFWAANRAIYFGDAADLISAATEGKDASSLFIDGQILRLLFVDPRKAVERREQLISAALKDFLEVRMGLGQDDSRPLGEFTFDEAD